MLTIYICFKIVKRYIFNQFLFTLWDLNFFNMISFAKPEEIPNRNINDLIKMSIGDKIDTSKSFFAAKYAKGIVEAKNISNRKEISYQAIFPNQGRKKIVNNISKISNICNLRIWGV